MVLYALYLCLLHSRFIENHPICILEDEPLISEVVLSQHIKVKNNYFNACMQKRSKFTSE
jgi:hypothetical protein